MDVFNNHVLEYLVMHKEEEAFVEFATQIQDLVVYVERTWVGSVRQLNKRQIINPPPPLPNQVVEPTTMLKE